MSTWSCRTWLSKMVDVVVQVILTSGSDHGAERHLMNLQTRLRTQKHHTSDFIVFFMLHLLESVKTETVKLFYIRKNQRRKLKVT